MTVPEIFECQEMRTGNPRLMRAASEILTIYKHDAQASEPEIHLLALRAGIFSSADRLMRVLHAQHRRGRRLNDIAVLEIGTLVSRGRFPADAILWPVDHECAHRL